MPSYPIPSCPVTILGPNANGFSLEEKKHKVGMRTEMGSTRYRVMNTSNIYVINCEFSFFTQAKFKEFLTWLKYETNYGNLWFKADWFDAIGFTAGDWIFRFVELPFSNTGYSQTHNATLLMAPYNTNVINPNVYEELGMGGEFIDSDFPFGWELFQSERIVQNRIYTSIMMPFDFNGSNITFLTEDSNVPVLPIGLTTIMAITPLSQTRFVYISSKTNGAVYEYYLVTYDYIDNVYTFRDSTLVFTTPTAGFPAPHEHDICTLSSTEIAIISKDSFTSTSDIFLRKAFYNGSVWALDGLALTIPLGTTSFYQPSICSLSSSRVVITLAGDNTTNVRLRAYDFGVGWSQVGSEFDTGFVCLQFNTNINREVVKARSATAITVNFAGTAQNKLYDYNFDGSFFTADTNSLFGLRTFAMVATDQIIEVLPHIFGVYQVRGFKRISGVWVQNAPTITSQVDTVDRPALNGLPHFMWNV